jgi:hypothetical protein
MQFNFKGLILLILSLSILSILDTQAQDTIKAPPPKPRHNDFLSRLDFGGYLGAQFGSVTLVDISPVVSYRVTPKFHTGLGLTYQFYKIDYVGAPDYKTSSYGGSIFGRYFIWRDLFAHIEYAPLYVTFYDYYFDNNGNYVSRQSGATWVNDVMLGGGYRQWIGQKAFMSLMFLWNINETYYSPYRNPIIRIGFGAGL